MTTQIEFIAPVPVAPAEPVETKPKKAKRIRVRVLTGKLDKRWADWAKREWKTSLVVTARKRA